jgi:hypothetical protein
MEHDNRAGTDREDRGINGFCRRNGMSRNKYFKDRKAGRGPREIRSGRWITISVEAEAAWKYAREHPDDTEQRLLQLEAEARLQGARKAGAASADSPKHISKQRKAAADARGRAGA